ncbi:447_t:CDS:2 [Gigaspora rosea]|nr:447_t:CDS:2 [Gigaspora rosea]
MSNNSLSKILSVNLSDVIRGSCASLTEIESYFKTFDQNNISEAFDATKNKQKVITANEWSAFTEKFYNLQVESQSGFKNLIIYLGEERKKNELIGKPTSESLDFFYLKSAIKKYNEKKYSSAYDLFRHLTSKGAVDRTGEEAIQIFSISMYYIALCYLNKNDEYAALGVPQFLERCNKYSDALKVYGLLDSETKCSTSPPFIFWPEVSFGF